LSRCSDNFTSTTDCQRYALSPTAFKRLPHAYLIYNAARAALASALPPARNAGERDIDTM